MKPLNASRRKGGTSIRLSRLFITAMISLLSQAEFRWINDYHAEVYHRLSPLLEGEDLAWLEQATRLI